MAVTLTTSQAYISPQKQTSVTCAAADTVTLDCNVHGDQILVQMPAGNITIANPLNPQVGYALMFKIIQDSTGGRTITWGSAFKKAISLSAGANAVDVVQFQYDGAAWLEQGEAKNIS